VAKSLIIRNLTAVNHFVNDLGIYIPAFATKDFTELFRSNRYLPAVSQDLIQKVNSDVLVVNDGSVDIAKADLPVWLERFTVADHDIVVDHDGYFPESRISDDNIFLRVNGNETITAPWTIGAGGSLSVEYGDGPPTGQATSGRVYWDKLNGALYVGDSSVWRNVSVTTSSFFGAPVMYEFGRNDYLKKGYMNTQWAISTSAPVVVPRKGTIKSLCIDAGLYRGTITSYQVNIHRYTGSNWVDFSPVVSITKTGGVGYAIKNNINVDFNDDERIACYVEAFGSNDQMLKNPHCYMEVVWRE